MNRDQPLFEIIAMIKQPEDLAYVRDEIYRTLAMRWTKVMVALFACGVVTGTILSFEMGLLWPEFMGTFGAVFGLSSIAGPLLGLRPALGQLLAAFAQAADAFFGRGELGPRSFELGGQAGVLL